MLSSSCPLHAALRGRYWLQKTTVWQKLFNSLRVPQHTAALVRKFGVSKFTQVNIITSIYLESLVLWVCAVNVGLKDEAILNFFFSVNNLRKTVRHVCSKQAPSSSAFFSLWRQHICFGEMIYKWPFSIPLPFGHPSSIFMEWPGVCCILLNQNNSMSSNSWDFFIWVQMLMHATAHRGCENTVRESALKVDCKKNPLPHLEMNLYQQSYGPNA